MRNSWLGWVSGWRPWARPKGGSGAGGGDRRAGDGPRLLGRVVFRGARVFQGGGFLRRAQRRGIVGGIERQHAASVEAATPGTVDAVSMVMFAEPRFDRVFTVRFAISCEAEVAVRPITPSVAASVKREIHLRRPREFAALDRFGDMLLRWLFGFFGLARDQPSRP